MMENLEIPFESNQFLVSKPQRKHKFRSNDIMGEKYQKLCRHSNRILSSKRAISTLGTVLKRNLIVDFWRDIGILRLLCIQTQRHRHTFSRHYYQVDRFCRQRWTNSDRLDADVTFLCDCSRRGGRGRPLTQAENRFSRVSGIGGSD